MEFSAERFSYVYSMIGPAGVALVFVALFAVYIAVWQFLYMSAVWRNFRRDFLDLERGSDRCLKDIDPKRANPLIRIIYEIVKTHGSHSDDIRAEVGYLFHRNFKRVSNTFFGNAYSFFHFGVCLTYCAFFVFFGNGYARIVYGSSQF